MPERSLYVIYGKSRPRVPPGSAVLSFMPPSEESGYPADGVACFYGRVEMDKIRDRARRDYLDLIASIGATSCSGRTLRSVLDERGNGNAWWYNKISEKQPEGDDIFDSILHIYTIMDIAERSGSARVVLCGASADAAKALRKAFKVLSVGTTGGWNKGVVRALLSRLNLLVSEALSLAFARRVHPAPEAGIRPDVAIQGFWGVSVKAGSGGVIDGYFKKLPRELEGRGLKCMWFVWLGAGPAPRAGSVTEGVALVFVQSFLTLKEIVLAVLDFSYARKYAAFSRSRGFRDIFMRRGVDLWPLMNRRILYYFLDGTVPRYRMMESAYRKAFLRYKPRAALTFLDLFLSARAFYRGADTAGAHAVKLNMQHAGCGSEKTFLSTDRSRETEGVPDGISVPQPDYYFAMSERYRDMLADNGIGPDRVFVTGSARYDHIKISGHGTANKRPRVLMAPTLNLKHELDMVDAAVAAAKDLGLELAIRSHPAARIEDAAGYRAYSGSVVSSSAGLEEDIASSDIVLFVYSSVAEEAFLKGVPVVQWRPAGFNGSVFSDIGGIRAARTTGELKEVFESFISDPAAFAPREDAKRELLARCFYRDDGMASVRIADKIREIIR